MQYIALLFVLYFLIDRLARIVPSLRMPEMSKAGGRRIALFCGAVGIIWVVEAVLPSTKMTGLDRVSVVIPPRHLDQYPTTNTPMTYGDIAQSQDWLWSLGALTRAEIDERLAADIAIAQRDFDQNAIAAKRTNGNRRSVALRLEEAYFRSEVLLAGLLRAQENLGELAIAGPVPAAVATNSIMAHVNTARVVIEANYRLLNQEAGEALRRFEAEGTDEATLNENPDYVAAKRAKSSANSDVVWSGIALNDFESLHWRSQTPILAYSPQLPFPQFNRPMMVFKATRDWVPQTHPPSAGPLVRFADAVTGRLRHSGTTMQARCGIGFAPSGDGVAMEKLCELSVPMEVNYDLTGQNCDSSGYTPVALQTFTDHGTFVANGVCKESWVYPHLNIIFSADRFTIYPPLPVPGQADDPATPPLSRWYATWNGTEKALDGPVSFDWIGQDSTLPALTLRHAPQEQVLNAKQWPAFRKLYPTYDIGQAITALAPSFEGATVQGFPHLFDVVDSFMQIGQPRQNRRERVIGLDLQVAKRINILESLSYAEFIVSSSSGQSGDHSVFCEIHGFRSREGLPSDIEDSVVAVLQNVSEDPCKGYYAYHTILTLAQRGNAEGSWAWMMGD